MTLSTSTAPDWSAWSRGTSDVRGPELPVHAADVRLRYNDVSTCQLVMPFTPAAWVAVGRGTRVEVRRHRRTVLNGSVIDRELSVNPDNPDGTITVTLESDEGLLADRLCFPNPALPFLSQTNGATYQLTAPGETLAKTLVNLNAGPGALAERRIPALTVEPDQGRGLTYLTILRYDNLLSTLQVIGRDWGPLGFRVDWTGTGRVFRVFTPPDLSGTVRFSVGLRNLDGIKYRDSAPTATYGMCEGGTLRYAETTTDPASVQYGRRVEVWSDAGSVESIADLQQPVRDALGSGRAPVGITLDPSPDYLLDADPAEILGARVTVQVGPLGYTDTIAVVDVVREVQLTYQRDDGTDDVIPVVGSDGATADTILNPYVGDLNRRLTQLERR